MVALPNDKSIPSDQDFNQRLQELVLTAQQAPPQSQQRQRALQCLIYEIQRSRQLSHPQQGRWLPHVYEDLYNEALQRTLLEVCQKIEGYNLTHPVMAWVNFLLKCHFSAVVKDYHNWKMVPMSVDDLDWLIAKEEPSDEADEAECLRDFLAEDPENRLNAVHIKGRPAVTFQFLALARSVHDQSWEQLSAELDISVQTLCSFFNRQLRKLMPYFYRYLQE
jgi:hypothetical protein